MMRREPRTPWFIVGNLNERLFSPLAIKGFRVRLSSLPWFTSVLGFLVLSGIFKPHAKQWIDFHSIIICNNPSFHYWYISTISIGFSMYSLKSHFYVFAVNLICTFSYVLLPSTIVCNTLCELPGTFLWNQWRNLCLFTCVSSLFICPPFLA